MSKIKITDRVKDLLSDFLKENDFELFDLEYIKEGSNFVLRIYIDKINPGDEENSFISTDDCQLVSNFISEKLDNLDFLDKQYYLEVSSPGLDRPLRSEGDYEKYKGRQIEISLYKPLNGQKLISGELVSLKDEIITVLDEKKKTIEIPITQAAIVRLAVIF